MNSHQAVIVDQERAQGRFVFVCEHASNVFPEAWGNLGLGADQRQAHIAWDPGALGLAWNLAKALDAPLVHAPWSRLIYDLNRPPQSRGAMAERSETHEISGNKNLSAAQRLARTKALYLPFHDRLRGVIALRLALGLQPILVTVHSFTPIYHGQKRAMEFGVIHDQDPRLAQALLARAKDHLGLITKLNEPYSAADEVTHTLALQATPYAIANVMLEVRNDLIATKAQQADLSARLAPILQDAVYDLTPSQGSH